MKPPETILPLDIVEDFLRKNGWAWEPLMRGDYGVTLKQVEMFIVASSPRLFAAAFLKNPATIDGSDIIAGEPLVLNEYQAQSIEYPGHIITQDGAEVGKTLEIMVRLIHKAMTVPSGSSLLGAPEMTHLLEVVDAIESQMSASPMVAESLTVKRRAPHYLLESSIGHRIHIIPGGYDGKAFRGKHVTTQAIFDEAAKVRNARVFSEFFRSMMPGCWCGIYSVPNGDRTTEYFRLKEAARKAGDGVSLADFKLFHRPKTIQPAPFWSAERAREMEDKYGGRHTAGYIHNVLGLDGDPENPIFPHSMWEKLITDIPEYRLVKLEASEKDETLRIEVFKIETGITGSRSILMADEIHPLADFRGQEAKAGALDALLTRFVPPPPLGLHYMGGDPGKINDPCEVVVRRQIGESTRRVLRLSMRGVPYDMQAEALEALHRIFSASSVGLDIGGAGTALLDTITRYYPNLEEVLLPSHFNGAIDAVDTEGEILEDPKTEKPIRKPFREVFVGILALRAQRGQLVEPYDIEVINSFTSYTARQGASGLIFSKEDDHIVDADVQAEGARILLLNASSTIAGGASSR